MSKEIFYQSNNLTAYKHEGCYYVIDVLSKRVLGQAQYNLKDALERAYSFIRGVDIKDYWIKSLSERQVLLHDLVVAAAQLNYDNLRSAQMVKHLTKWKNVCGGMSYHHRIEINSEFPEDMSLDIYFIKTNKTIEVDGIPVQKEITLQTRATQLDNKRQALIDILDKFVNDPTSI